MKILDKLRTDPINVSIFLYLLSFVVIIVVIALFSQCTITGKPCIFKEQRFYNAKTEKCVEDFCTECIDVNKIK